MGRNNFTGYQKVNKCVQEWSKNSSNSALVASSVITSRETTLAEALNELYDLLVTR